MTPTQERKTQQPMVGLWLFIVCAFVLAMVVVGGATRLTDSGLSITEWDLGKGLTPPLTASRWAEEFALYQRTAEYQLQNAGMSLSEFQSIYWWEWGHRFLGKMIGLVFALPFAFFWATRRLKGRFASILALFALGGLQGAIGWWMVTSGLWSGLDVSPLRLAVHLGMAFAIAGFALWMALDCFGWPRASKAAAPAWSAPAFLALLFAQIMFGAFLAGSDGGPAYADWPLIGGQLWPHGAFEGAPLWTNHASQHLLHRSTGYLVALSALAIAWVSWRRGEGAARKLGLALGGLALAQAGLGVATLLAVSPLSLSLAHQFGAALLWLTGVALCKSSR